MKRQTPHDAVYQVTTYDGEKMTTVAMNRAQLKDIDPQSVDHYLSFAFGRWEYRDAEGQWITQDLDSKGLGNTGLAILLAVQDCPGEFLTPHQIWDQTDIYSLKTPNNLSARWMSLRRAHEESFTCPHFFLSRRTGGMAVAWNRTRTWMRVERLSQSINN